MSNKHSFDTDLPRHHRSPDQIDKDAFRDAMQGVRRLQSDRVHHRTAPPAPRPRQDQRQLHSYADLDDRGLVDTFLMEQELPAQLQWSRPGLQRRIIRDLKRGKLRPQVDIDLHGMTVEQARMAFAHFLQECRYANLRVARIIHGKGYGSGGGTPVIKTHLYRWLTTRPEIAAFCSALPRDGGTGAVYVLLRVSQS